MPKLILLWIFYLCFSLGAISQTINLSIEIHADSPHNKQQLKFSTAKDAEQYFFFKIDSLEKSGYPFLTYDKNFESDIIRTKIKLNQKIDTLYLNINEEHLNLIPETLFVNEHHIEIPYSGFQELQVYILNQLQYEGEPFGKISLKNFSLKARNILRANLIIERKKQRKIDKINIKGYPKLSKNYVTKFSNLKVGSLFVESEVQDKTEQLNNIPFLKVRKPTEVLFQKDSTELFIYVEKVNANSFDGFLGFGSTEEESFEVNGYLNMVLLNNLNFGERLAVTYKNDGIGQQTFEGDINLPFLFNTPISIGAKLRLFRRDSAFSNTTQNLTLNYQLNERLSIMGGVETTNSSGLETESNPNANSIQDFNSTFYEVGFNFLKLNTRAQLQEDTFLNLRAGLGQRETNEEIDQYKLSITGQYLFSLNSRNKIYTHLNSQILISDTYLNNELFRFGGVNSIRGFAENSLIASRFAVLQTEYRYLLDSNLFANTVIDLGNYENEIDNVNENILGYGIGLGLKSKAGIFRLVVANAISDALNSSLSSSKIHISFRSFF